MPWRRNHRPVYGKADLKRLIEPQSIAIVGLSQNPASFGARTLANLQHCDVRKYGVNPKASELHGVPCFASPGELPETVDCAIIATPQDAVEPLVEQCAEAGIGGCVIYASGYAETGREDRIARQERLAAIARASGMRIIGPNCIGIVNNFTRAGMLFLGTYEQTPWRPGPIGLISQSGALGFTLAQAAERGGSFSHYLTAGNSCDVDVCDYMSYLVDDENCRVVTCLVEGLKDGERLIEVGEKAAGADKPIVIYKMATGNAAAQAAMSHTGSITGSNAAYDSVFRRYGMIAVENLEQVYETAAFLAKAGMPKSTGVAVMATSGGACVLAADKAELHGVPMPQPGPAAQAVLEAVVPDFGSARNPCDVTAQVINNPSYFTECTKAMLADPVYGALVLPQTVVGEYTASRVQTVSDLAGDAGKPICIAWMTEWLEGPGSHLYEADPNVALFRSTDRCFRTLAAWHWRAARLHAPADRARRAPGGPSVETARRLLAEAGPRITEREAKAVLAAYGVPVTGERLVEDEDAAVAASAALGYPIVLKVEAPEIAHKTEAGVVRLDLRDEAAVRRAYREIMAAAARVEPRPKIRGVLVQPMIPAGLELVVGARVDPQFGPLVVVGMGGVLVEVLRDTASDLAPVDRAQACRLIESLRAYPLLTGYRGAKPADLDRLAEIVVRVSELAADFALEIAEIDVNPLICSGDRIVAVDALLIRAETSHEGPAGAA
ncbi:MAG TPA: acetate--CoA ligase family protein [Aliidongia sp.]|nr:acetate--CoA ligase family protein [Aliidongia sp.]